MSDQPTKPRVSGRVIPKYHKPTTGEWTAVNGDLNTGITEIFPLGRHRAKTIADAHNAALSAERREKERWQDEYARKVTEHENTKGICDILNEQLAAEREKVKGLHAACRAERAGANEAEAARDEVIRLLEYKEKQLAAAQAAIKEHNCDPNYDCPHIEADNAAFDAAMSKLAAEVQTTVTNSFKKRIELEVAAAHKPLVDALKLCLSALRHEDGSSQMRACIAADVQLAKVKEGKWRDEPAIKVSGDYGVTISNGDIKK